MKLDISISVGYGLYAATDSQEEFENSLDKNAIQIGRTLLEAGNEYDLDDFFCRKVRYCGLYTEGNNNHMVFFLGKEQDMFECVYYYELIFWLTETRFFCHYTKQGGKTTILLMDIGTLKKRKNKK